MVLDFKNTITLLGASPEYRNLCFIDLNNKITATQQGDATVKEFTNSTVVTIKSFMKPLDNELLELASKYLAIDFINTATPLSTALLRDWQLMIKIRDQEVRFSDNYEYKGGQDLGNIYQVKLAGGFPACLKNNP